MNPWPQPRSVLVLDNCAIHDKYQLNMLAALHGFHVEFLPPYSPIYNPIENLFGTYKTWLQSNRRIVSEISPYDAIKEAMLSVTPEMCNAWVRAIPFYNVD